MQNNTTASRHLAYVANKLTILTFHVGHFRVRFVLQSEESLDKSMVCFKSFGALSSLLRGTNADPMAFLPAAQEFQSSSILSGLIFTSIALSFACCILLLNYRSWLIEANRLGVPNVSSLGAAAPKPF